MKLINNNGILQYIADENETAENIAFLTRISEYSIKANGALIQIFKKDSDENGELVLCINPSDNTQFICTPDGHELSKVFGGKRFLVGQTREHSATPGATLFKNDLSFPIAKQVVEPMLEYDSLNLLELLERFRSDKSRMYAELAELFNRCADFLPGKQQEYLEGGKVADKFCRFNLANDIGEPGLFTEHFFLLKQNQIVGSLSATILYHRVDESVDVYFYDEVADYFTLLDADEKAMLTEMREAFNLAEEEYNLASDDAKEGKKEQVDFYKKQISMIVEPLRAKIMAQLFVHARHQLRKSVFDLDKKIEQGLIHAFIRATSARLDSVAAFAGLGCSATNPGHYVIHGAPTAQLKLLTSFVKSWGAEQLAALQQKPSTTSFMTSANSAGLSRQDQASGKFNRAGF